MMPWQYHVAFDAHKRLVEMALRGEAGLQSKRIHGAAMRDDPEIRPAPKNKHHSGNMEAEILECLQTGPKTQLQLWKSIGCCKATTSIVVRALHDQGLIKPSGWDDHVWGRKAMRWELTNA